MRKFISVILLACTSLLASCSKTASDPTPDTDRQHRIQGTRHSAVKAGEPFKVDGCDVQVYKVYSETGGVFGSNMFTLATANCETANVTAVNEGCGKSCVNDNIRVEAVANKGLAQAHSRGYVEKVVEAAKKMDETQAKKVLELQVKLEQLRAEADKVSAELEKSK